MEPSVRLDYLHVTSYHIIYGKFTCEVFQEKWQNKENYTEKKKIWDKEPLPIPFTSETWKV